MNTGAQDKSLPSPDIYDRDGESRESGAEADVCVEGTTRDRVWDATLDLVHHRPIPFQLWRVRKRAGLGQQQDRTIRRTLAVMADAGWLDHDENSKYWYPGEKAERRLR